MPRADSESSIEEGEGGKIERNIEYHIIINIRWHEILIMKRTKTGLIFTMDKNMRMNRTKITVKEER